ncbi:hypothetical protein EVA_17861, partial [gut metagenome]
ADICDSCLPFYGNVADDGTFSFISEGILCA